jgi:hypothetical protein
MRYKLNKNHRITADNRRFLSSLKHMGRSYFHISFFSSIHNDIYEVSLGDELSSMGWCVLSASIITRFVNRVNIKSVVGWLFDSFVLA